MVTSGISIVFFNSVCRWFFCLETLTSYMQNPMWMKNIRTTVSK